MFRSLVSKAATLKIAKAATNFQHARLYSSVRPLGPMNKVPQFEGNAIVKDFTFVCPTEIIAFSDRAAEFRKLNTEIVACSCDSHYSHLAWCQTARKDGGLGEMNIPVLSDFNKKIARDFGVLDENTGLSYRGLFLIDPKGDVRHCLVNDLPVGRSVDEALRILKAFQFVEKHGEVCPADWEDEKPTINVKSPKDYFSKVNKK